MCIFKIMSIVHRDGPSEMALLIPWRGSWNSCLLKAPRKVKAKAKKPTLVFVWLGIIDLPTLAIVQLPIPAFYSLRSTLRWPTLLSYAQNATSFTETKFLTCLVGKSDRIGFISTVCLTHISRKNSRLSNPRMFGIVRYCTKLSYRCLIYSPSS